MLIGLATLIILLLGSGQTSFMLDPALKKQVKTHVEDKHRRSAIDDLITRIEKDQKSFMKERKVAMKVLTDLNSNYSSTLNQFETLFENYHNKRVELQHTYLDREMAIRELITESEWDRIMKELIEQPDKEKVRKHVFESNEKLFNNFTRSCEKIMTSPDSIQKTKVVIDRQRKLTEAFLDEFLNLGYRNLEPIRRYNATLVDFESIREQMSEHHKKYLNSIIEFRFSIISLASEKEWKGISKELNSLFKKGSGNI